MLYQIISSQIKPNNTIPNQDETKSLQVVTPLQTADDPIPKYLAIPCHTMPSQKIPYYIKPNNSIANQDERGGDLQVVTPHLTSHTKPNHTLQYTGFFFFW